MCALARISEIYVQMQTAATRVSSHVHLACIRGRMPFGGIQLASYSVYGIPPELD